MMFTFTQDQLDFGAAATAFLAGECTAEHLRKMVEAGASFDASRWAGIEELGLTAACLPEDKDGLGLAAIDVILIAEACGYAALPEPLVTSAFVAAPALAFMDDTVAGRVAIVDSREPATPQADQADTFLVIEDERLSLLTKANAELTPVASVDPLQPCFTVKGAAKILTEEAWAVEALRDRLSLFAAAELVGLATRMIDMAVAYAQERQQFGKPIGSFQAVKHHLSSALVAVEFVKPLVYRAAQSMMPGVENRSLHVSHAKLKAGEAAILAAETAIQVHGAMGYTYEVDLHLWMKRVWALAGAAGDAATHENNLEALVLDGGLAVGPGTTF